jgi:hypothetical protein
MESIFMSKKAPKHLKRPIPPPPRLIREGVCVVKTASKKKHVRGSFADFKKMTIAIAKRRRKANKTLKLWREGYSSDGIHGLLEAMFLNNPTTPRAAQMHEWNEIERLQRQNHPIAYFLLRDCDVYFSVKMRRLSDIKWWFKYRLMKKHRYHIVDTGLKPGYYDCDTILLNAAMAVLVDHVENEAHGCDKIGEAGLQSYIEFYEKLCDPKNWEPWERKQSKKIKQQCIEHRVNDTNALKEILAIYKWWKYYRTIEHMSLEQERDEFYKTERYDIMTDERDPNKLTGKDKKKYIEQRKIVSSFIDREQKLYEKDTDMLVRLAKVRSKLWD